MRRRLLAAALAALALQGCGKPEGVAITDANTVGLGGVRLEQPRSQHGEHRMQRAMLVARARSEYSAVRTAVTTRAATAGDHAAEAARLARLAAAAPGVPPATRTQVSTAARRVEAAVARKARTADVVSLVDSITERHLAVVESTLVGSRALRDEEFATVVACELLRDAGAAYGQALGGRRSPPAYGRAYGTLLEVRTRYQRRASDGIANRIDRFVGDLISGTVSSPVIPDEPAAPDEVTETIEAQVLVIADAALVDLEPGRLAGDDIARLEAAAAAVEAGSAKRAESAWSAAAPAAALVNSDGFAELDAITGRLVAGEDVTEGDRRAAASRLREMARQAADQLEAEGDTSVDRD